MIVRILFLVLFNKKREANKLEETVFYENCELTR
jgi:hypothetical protein